MYSVIGLAAAVVGLSGSVLGVLGGAYALTTSRLHLLRTVRTWAWIVSATGVVMCVVMLRALAVRDFTVDYVQQVGSPNTPTLYNIAALWSSLEGSLLLWILVLGGFTAAMLVKFRDRHDDALFGWALVVMLGVSAFFYALVAGPANPFTAVDIPVGFEPRGPNPLLQNHVLVAFHPPMLYLGYVGFTVPFAFATAALITGRLGEGWLIETRRWTVVAYGFLTGGILLGAWWSYEVLGWGGYWAWDPVENASLLPWLTGTAYLHSVMVQERRGMLRVWNLALVCSTFCLTVLGTFITRSGVIDSVHAFSDGPIGAWFLGLFGVVTFGSIGLIAWRGDQLRSPGSIDSPLSREASFLANNLLFGAMAFVVLLGTVFPLLAELWDGSRLTIGSPYFDSMAKPLGLLMLFLMAAAPILPWRKASGEVLSDRLFWPAVLGVVAMVVALVYGGRGWAPVLAFGLGGFAGGSALRQVVLATRRHGWRGFVGRTNGGMIVHIGVVLVAVGLVAADAYKVDRTVSLEVGETATVNGHTFTYLGGDGDQNSRRIRIWADIQIDGEDVYQPATTLYREQGVVVPTPSVRPGFSEDLFLVTDAVQEPGQPVRLRVVIRPMVTWIWTGGMLMFAGTVLAVFPGRRRRGTEPVSVVSSELAEQATPA